MTVMDARESVSIAIGGTSIQVASDNPAFLDMLRRQYGEFVAASSPDSIRLEIEIAENEDAIDSDADLRVEAGAGVWNFARGDFEARYDSIQRRGVVRQSANRHSIDSVIRVIHTLTLANEGGFLLHAASAIRNDAAFLFAGHSGAGKTTLSRLAPRDASLLSDEVSFVRRSAKEYRAWGTPFTGELGTPGVNRSAPVKALCFLRQAAACRLIPIEPREALRLLLTNVLFFANDPGLVGQVFNVASEFVGSVPSYRMEFTPDARSWELIQ